MEGFHLWLAEQLMSNGWILWGIDRDRGATLPTDASPRRRPTRRWRRTRAARSSQKLTVSREVPGRDGRPHVAPCLKPSHDLGLSRGLVPEFTGVT
jgi:hypothetical protein